uniref:Adenylate kinase 7a n=1 Tax=Myripristis murdjan TaxID=586833 RepID=A0A667Z6Q8_9TELE
QFLSTCVPGESSEDAEADEDTTSSPGHEQSTTFQIVGTVSSSSPSSSSNEKKERKSFLEEQYKSPTRDQLLERLLECDVVVYNISENATQEQIEEATWAITALHDEMESFRSQKMFILVSTVMTWALTKPRNLDDSDVLLTDDDYRRRRPHPNFKNHCALEKLVLKLGRAKKSKLTSYVVASGLQYGQGENLFHYFFKVSWSMQFPKVPVFGVGTNCIPMIHVYDLGGVIRNIIDLKPKSKYVLALDDSKNTLEDIIKMISYVLGPGKIDKLPEQEAIHMNALTPEELEYLSVNLYLEPVLLKDTFNLQWTSEAGMVENMDRIVEEYKNTRQLLPIRICVTGPPAVGKTTVAQKLCQHYKVHHIKINEVIAEKLEILSGADTEDVPGEEVDAAKNQLQTIREGMEKNAGRLADHLLCDILQEKLNSKPCSNQGFVLDGFPKMYEQAKLIFFDEDTERTSLKSKTPHYPFILCFAERVFALDASDEFLMKRAQGLPQSVAEEMFCTQDEFVARLARYRQVNASEETLLDYFDELEIHPKHIEISTDDPEYTEVVKKITEVVGTPKNYGPSPEEQEEEARRLEEERRQKMAMDAAERRRRNEAALAEMTAQYEEWNVSEVKRQEYELLEAQSLPLRNYLMKYVMPSLTEAMLECCTVKPEDPVDFLAEHLLRNNQQK